jgi:hypothetical protein
MAAEATGSPKKRVLFVCLGNICRSPLAEGVFLSLVEAAGLSDTFEVDWPERDRGTSANDPMYALRWWRVSTGWS